MTRQRNSASMSGSTSKCSWRIRWVTGFSATTIHHHLKNARMILVHNHNKKRNLSGTRSILQIKTIRKTSLRNKSWTSKLKGKSPVSKYRALHHQGDSKVKNLLRSSTPCRCSSRSPNQKFLSMMERTSWHHAWEYARWEKGLKSPVDA